MKNFFAVIVLVAVLTACQQEKKQYFTAGPEIDLIKKIDQSYMSSDFGTIRDSYADTAKIWLNTWGSNDDAISVDTLVVRFQTARANFTELKMSDFKVYEMVELDNGDRWVHRWLGWDVTHKNGKSFSYPSHAAFLVMGGKIRGAGYIFNALPGHLATEDSTATR